MLLRINSTFLALQTYREFKNQNYKTDKDAFDIMELKHDAKWEDIKKKFKTLVKKYHPDKNSGNKKFEDKLKKITLAYSQLKMRGLEGNNV